ncbi:hypothetical protein ACJJI5_11205 [Microbulbifer sp. EKSA008]|uniref:hypothetical protein n=1 Tax=Microbulbifer sp. EKSA008 TaxID=3243367 RepID=UPI0040435F9E
MNSKNFSLKTLNKRMNFVPALRASTGQAMLRIACRLCGRLRMAKIIFYLGILIFVYTLIAIATGIPELVDFVPLNWVQSTLENGYYKVVPSDSPSVSKWYTLGIAVILILAGYFAGGPRKK